MCTTSQEVKCILIQVPFVQIILHMKTNDDDYRTSIDETVLTVFTPFYTYHTSITASKNSQY